MAESERFPLRVDAVTAAAQNEWRVGDELPAQLCENWQLVYLRSGLAEEQTDNRRTVLRAGMLLFHQPEERHAMRAIGDLPPIVLRVEFACAGPAMDIFRERVLRVNAAEKACLRQLAESAAELFEQPEGVLQRPVQRSEPPYAAAQLAALALEHLLILMYRRLNRTRRPSPRAVAEQNEAALVEAVRLYFAKNLDRSLTLAETCRTNECGRVQLQRAFGARTHMAPMTYFACMRLEHAAQLLSLGHTPGAVAKMLGYSSEGYFSQRFTAAAGVTPAAYRRGPQPLQLCNK